MRKAHRFSFGTVTPLTTRVYEVKHHKMGFEGIVPEWGLLSRLSGLIRYVTKPLRTQVKGRGEPATSL